MMIDGNGELVDPELANKTLKRVWDILEDAIDHSKTESEAIPAERSLYDEFITVTQRQMDNGVISSYERELILSTSEMWGAYVGDSVHRQSMKFYFLEDCIEGDDCFVPTNYKKIIEKIGSLPREKAHIMYNTAMASITSASASHGIQVSTTDGTQLYFDAVVVTIPLGCLKQRKNSIIPMNERLSNAIQNISYGRLEKIFVEFPSAFWESPNPSNSEEDRKKTSFIHWLSPSYAPETNPKGWRIEVDSFNALDAPYRRSILLFYTFGECSTHITSNIRGLSDIERHCWLQRFLEPYYSRLPNYNAKTCTPLRYLATEWSNDEFAGYGSYSNFQVGMQDAAGDVEAIRYGMPEHNIYFAGEHTAPFDGLGTITGAYKSGEAVAHRIVKSLS